MSGIATGTAIAIAAGTSAAGGIASGVIGSNAAGNAASTQANSADYVANLQQQEADQALNFEQQQYAQQQQEEQPYLQSGEGGLANLDYLLGVPTPNQGATDQVQPGNPANGATSGGQIPGTASLLPSTGARPGQVQAQSAPPAIKQGSSTPTTPNGAPGAITLGNGSTLPGVPSLSSLVNPSLGAEGSLSQGWGQTFTPPTAQQAAQTPGYQFQLDQGNQAIQRSAAASGDLLSGGTEKALDQYSQGLASTNYQQAYNNAYNQYSTNYNQFEQNQNNEYNRLASLAGLGQTSVAQLGQIGSNAASNTSNILLNSGAQVGQNINNAGAARSSGYVGQANAINGGISSVGSAATTASLLNLLQNGGTTPGSIGGDLNASNGYYENI